MKDKTQIKQKINKENKSWQFCPIDAGDPVYSVQKKVSGMSLEEALHIHGVCLVIISQAKDGKNLMTKQN